MRTRRGIVLAGALVLALALAGCGFVDWVGGSAGRGIALESLATDLRKIDGVSSVEYQNNFTQYPLTANVDVMMADLDAEAWQEVGARLGEAGADSAFADVAFGATVHDADSLSAQVSPQAGGGVGIGERLGTLVGLQNAVGAPLEAVVDGEQLSAVSQLEPVDAARLLGDPAVLAGIDGALAGDLNAGLSFPGLWISGRTAPGAVGVFAEAASRGLIDTCIDPEGSCTRPPEWVHVDWYAGSLQVQYVSTVRAFDDPSPDAIAVIRAALAAEAALGQFQYNSAPPGTVGAWPTVGFLVSDCSQVAPLEADQQAWAEQFSAALAAEGVDVPKDRFGWCVAP